MKISLNFGYYITGYSIQNAPYQLHSVQYHMMCHMMRWSEKYYNKVSKYKTQFGVTHLDPWFLDSFSWAFFIRPLGSYIHVPQEEVVDARVTTTISLISLELYIHVQL